MTCKYLSTNADGKYCQLKNSQLPNKYVRRVCVLDAEATVCIKALETLKEADRLSKENNISCVTLYREASDYFAQINDLLKAILCRINLIKFLKTNSYYDQAILEAKEMKELYNDALRSAPSLSKEIGDKIASLEQSLQVAYNQSESSGLVKPSAVLQTISEIQIEEAVGHIKHYSIENDLEKEIEHAIEKEVTGEDTSKSISKPPETSLELDATGTTTEVGSTTVDVATVVTNTTTESEATMEVGGTIESVETIEDADSSVGFLPHYVEKAENYEKLTTTQIAKESFDKAAKYAALSTISWILAGNPQEGLMTLNRLLKDSKATERQTIKNDPIFIIARSLILSSFNKDMGKYYEAELLVRQLKGYSDEEMEIIGQGLKTVKELIE